MPPDQAGQGMASMLAALGRQASSRPLDPELFGVKTSGHLSSAWQATPYKCYRSEIRSIQGFGLKRLSTPKRLEAEARSRPIERSIITIKVDDGNPERVRWDRSMWIQLNGMVVPLDTCLATRVFWRMVSRKCKWIWKSREGFEQLPVDYIDVKEQGRAMMGAPHIGRTINRGSD